MTSMSSYNFQAFGGLRFQATGREISMLGRTIYDDKGLAERINGFSIVDAETTEQRIAIQLEGSLYAYKDPIHRISRFFVSEPLKPYEKIDDRRDVTLFRELNALGRVDIPDEDKFGITFTDERKRKGALLIRLLNNSLLTLVLTSRCEKLSDPSVHKLFQSAILLTDTIPSNSDLGLSDNQSFVLIEKTVTKKGSEEVMRLKLPKITGPNIEDIAKPGNRLLVANIGDVKSVTLKEYNPNNGLDVAIVTPDGIVIFGHYNPHAEEANSDFMIPLLNGDYYYFSCNDPREVAQFLNEDITSLENVLIFSAVEISGTNDPT